MALPPGIQCVFDDAYLQEIPIALALLIMAFVIALAHMAARFIKKPEWEAWAKTELYQLAISCLLAGSIIFIAETSCILSYQLSGPPGVGGDAFYITGQFLSTYYDEGVTTMYSLYSLKMIADGMSQFTIMVATNPMYIIPKYPGAGLVSQGITAVIGIMSILTANLMVQKVIFQFIQQFGFSILLPIGLLLRVFPFSRDAGAFLIAIAFGLYIVFPLLYVVSAQVMQQMPEEHSPQLLGAVGGFLPSLTISYETAFLFIYGPFSQLFVLLKNLNLVLAATFFPALNMMITVTFIRGLAKAIIHHTGQ
jgi:hypothetical protein